MTDVATAEESMRAVVLREEGDPSVLRVEHVPIPTPGPDEIRVRLSHASLNHLDLWIRKGMPSVERPRVMGADGAGIVDAIGPGTEPISIGYRAVIDPSITCGRCRHCLAGNTVYCPDFSVLGEHRAGTHAEYVIVPAVNVHPTPSHLSDLHAGALPLAFATAWRMIVSRAQARPGESMLIWGASSGVGCAAIQIARHLGIQTIATSRSARKLDRLTQLGADHVIDSSETDVVAAVRSIVGRDGLDIVFDHLGDVAWKPSMVLLGPGGRFVTCGATTGANPPVGITRLFWKGLTVLGSTMATKADFADMLSFVSRFEIEPLVDASYDLDEIVAAHEHMERAGQIGKIVLSIDREQ